MIDADAAVDALKELTANGTNRGMVFGEDAVHRIEMLPSVQPERKGTRLSTVCLLCKKPAVTFNTEDDIPYTNYSYCEDCLRKGLKLLREQKKNLQTQPEHKTGRWIPVSERLPEEGEVVLTQAKFKDDMKMAVSSRIDYNYWTTWGTRDINIIAWIPLPEPYQEGEQK